MTDLIVTVCGVTIGLLLVGALVGVYLPKGMLL